MNGKEISINTPINVKKVDKLTEVERKVFLMIVYLEDKPNNHYEGQYSDDLLKEIYKNLYDEEIDTKTLYKACVSLNNIQIDFSDSRFNDFIGIPILATMYNGELCMVITETCPITHLFKPSFSVSFNDDNTIKNFLLILPKNDISRRAVMAIFNEDKDVRFWKIIYDDKEEGDMSYDEFCKMITNKNFRMED